MKIIFLDIDGVLNNSKTDLDEFIDEALFQRILDLIYTTQAKVVMSSNWRCYPDAIMKFKNHPLVNDYFLYDILPAHEEDKGKALREYLKKHEEITNYVVIDDEENKLFDKRHFVKTTFEKGFDHKALVKAKKILKGELELLCQ